jgi:nitrogen regulatory protein P-II 2
MRATFPGVQEYANSTERDRGAAGKRMKLIIAIIQPPKLKAVQEALRRIGVSRLTVGDAMGFARQRGQDETYRGAEYKTNLLRKVALEIAVNDDFAEKTIECLQQVARTGNEGTIGDGKVIVLPMEQAIQISDGYRGPGAI